jgi:hypothetical protein
VKVTGGQQYFISKTMFILQNWYVLASDARKQNVFKVTLYLISASSAYDPAYLLQGI